MSATAECDKTVSNAIHDKILELSVRFLTTPGMQRQTEEARTIT